jgi:hypothetical protein
MLLGGTYTTMFITPTGVMHIIFKEIPLRNKREGLIVNDYTPWLSHSETFVFKTEKLT